MATLVPMSRARSKGGTPAAAIRVPYAWRSTYAVTVFSTPADCSLALLEEIELSVEFEVQCARYDALYFSADDAELFALHA